MEEISVIDPLEASVHLSFCYYCNVYLLPGGNSYSRGGPSSRLPAVALPQVCRLRLTPPHVVLARLEDFYGT